jgi:hypothetical protein
MPLSTKNAYTYINNCLNASPNSLKTQQLSGAGAGLTDSSVGWTVATIADLPAPGLNEGRFIYVTECNSYRYSDGAAWTNDYDTTEAIAFNFLLGCGTNSYMGPSPQFSGTNSWSQTASAGVNWDSVGDGVYIRQSALTKAGEMYNWGYRSGACGTDCSTSPVRECQSMSGFCYVSDGEYHSMALKTDGSLWSYSGLGWWENFGPNGTNIWCNSRDANNCRVNCGWTWLDTTYIDVSAGQRNTTVIKSDGTLWSQGLLCKGQDGSHRLAPSLGQYNTTCSSPVQEITSSTNWCCVDTGHCSAGAIKTDGTWWNWGSNCYGSLGVESNINTSASSPVQEVSNSTNWCTIHVRCDSRVGIKTDGTMWGMGNRASFGGGNCSASSPVQELGSATNWSMVGGPRSTSGNRLALNTAAKLYGNYNTCWCAETCNGVDGANFCNIGGANSMKWAIQYATKGFSEP